MSAIKFPDLDSVGNMDFNAGRLRVLLDFCDFFFANRTPLCRIMNEAGSDKANGWHNYGYIYHFLLSAFIGKNPRVLEIGIGTNFSDIPSSMGPNGTPGASLRAWRDYFGSDAIFGADVDQRILFEEPGIKTFFVDQTNPATLHELAAKFYDSPLDIIIDDGLHRFDANVNTMRALYPILRRSGVYIVEDVSYSVIPKWQEFLRVWGMNACIVRPKNNINPIDNCFIYLEKF